MLYFGEVVLKLDEGAKASLFERINIKNVILKITQP